MEWQLSCIVYLLVEMFEMGAYLAKKDILDDS